jgi:hypothetical protein
MAIELFNANGVSLGFKPTIRSAINAALNAYRILIGEGSYNISAGAPPGWNTFARTTAKRLSFLGAGSDLTTITGNARVYVEADDGGGGSAIPTGMTLEGMRLTYSNGSGYILQAGNRVPGTNPLPDLTIRDVVFSGSHSGQSGANGNYVYMWKPDRFRLENITVTLTGQSGFSPTSGGGSAFLFCQQGEDIRIGGSFFNENGYRNAFTFIGSSKVQINGNTFQRTLGSSATIRSNGEILSNTSASIGTESANFFRQGAYLDLRDLPDLPGSAPSMTIKGNTFQLLNGGYGILLRPPGFPDDSKDPGYADLVSSKLSVTANTFTGGLAVKSALTTPSQITLRGTNNIQSTIFDALIVGGTAADTLIGTTKNEWISGDLGNDTLIGGGGADAFVFATPLNASTNVDTITEFVNGNGGDRIWLDDNIFSTGTSFNTDITYNSGTGALSYEGVQFAILANKPTGLSQAAFVVF